MSQWNCQITHTVKITLLHREMFSHIDQDLCISSLFSVVIEPQNESLSGQWLICPPQKKNLPTVVVKEDYFHYIYHYIQVWNRISWCSWENFTIWHCEVGKTVMMCFGIGYKEICAKGTFFSATDWPSFRLGKMTLTTVCNTWRLILKCYVERSTSSEVSDAALVF